MTDTVQEQPPVGDELRWHLDDVVTLSEFNPLLERLRGDLEYYSSLKEQLRPDMSETEFDVVMATDESIITDISRLMVRSEFMLSVDQKDQEARMMRDRASDLFTAYNNARLPLELWLKGLPQEGIPALGDKDAARLFASVPELTYFLEHQREDAKHTLNEQAEKVDAVAQNVAVAQGLIAARDKLASSLTYTLQLEGEDTPTILTSASKVVKHTTLSVAADREAAYRALFASFSENIDLFFILYQARVKMWANTANLREYPSSISVRNFRNMMPDPAVASFLDVCTSPENLSLFRDYFVWKAQLLGQSQADRFHIYAPLQESEAPQRTYTLTEALRMTMETFRGFSSGFAQRAEQIIGAQHIDSHPREGKDTGAFCEGGHPGLVPYVMLNFNGTARDVSTVAHELGHGIHYLYSNRQSVFTQGASLPLAETASTFSELLLFERLFAEASPDEQQALLSQKMAHSYQTIVRQVYFTRFELAAHEAIMKGVTQEELSDIYMNTLTEQFGNAVQVDPIFRHEWAYVPHLIHNPFYCYAYPFGDLLSTALFGQYKQEGESFVPKLEAVLSAGSSQSPDSILQGIGVDMSSPKFWQQAFDVLAKYNEQLQAK